MSEPTDVAELRAKFDQRFTPDPETGCWVRPTNDGRPFRVRPNFCGEVAARAAWEIYRAPIPPGLLVCHTCDNEQCVNPDHLFLGTHTDNARDRNAKGRWRRGKSEVRPEDLRVITPMAPGLVEAIDDFRFANRIDSRSEAIRQLIQLGLDAATKNASPKRPARRPA